MKKLYVVFTSLMLFCSAAQAVHLENPYTVDVPVASQSAADRPAAERSGLLLVLERLSGQRLDGSAPVKAALGKAENYVQQFSYVQDATVAGAAPTWRVRLVFAQPDVDALLREAGAALWSLDRPQVMLLMLDAQNHWLPSADNSVGNPSGILQQIGQSRGVPLLLPDNSAADVTTLAAVQGLDTTSLMPQAVQQGADALLLGNVRGSDEKGWSGQWLLRFHDQDQPLQEKAVTLPLLVDAVLRQAAEYLSASYRNSVTTDTGPAQLRLQVDGVRSYAAFMQLRQYLERLDAVQRITATQINGTTVVIDLDVKGRESFRNLVALFKSLQWKEEILPPQGSDPSLKPVWHYQWEG